MYSKFIILIFAVLVMASCKKEQIDPNTDLANLSEGVELGNFSELNASNLSARLNMVNELILWEDAALVKEEPEGYIRERDLPTPSNDIVWTYVANASAINYQAYDLSATHVEILGNKAFVSHHVQGDVHRGALEVIDLTDKQNPVVLSQAFFDNADINSITVDYESTENNVRVWAALSDFNKGAMLVEIEIVNGIIENQFRYVNMSKQLNGSISASANSVVRAGEFLYVSSGKTNGGIFCYDVTTLDYVGHTPFSNSKYVVANGTTEGGSKVVALETGTNSSIRVTTVGSTDFTTQIIPIAQIDHQNTANPGKGKNTLRFDPNNDEIVYIGMGANGLKSYNINTGALVFEESSELIGNGNSNGLAFDGELMYVANGAAGLAIYRMDELGGTDPELVFLWDLNEDEASANYVQAEGDWIFVAKGLGGFKILKRPQIGDLIPLSTFNANGLPENLGEDIEVCNTLLSNVFATALPEGQNAITAHPEFFAESVVREIYLEEAAEINLSFIHEGAGYKNTLGYYYYDVNNPPATPDDLIKCVIFPNASQTGSGGELEPGNTMQILGSFDENTVIGFFLIANGFQNNEITNGITTQYTINGFNTNQDKQALLFHDAACDASIICFEDINVTEGGDRDYNDAIFQITADPPSAMNTQDFLQL